MPSEKPFPFGYETQYMRTVTTANGEQLIKKANVVAVFVYHSEIVLKIDSNRKDRRKTDKEELSSFATSVGSEDWERCYEIVPELKKLNRQIGIPQEKYPYVARALLKMAITLSDDATESTVYKIMRTLVSGIMSGKGTLSFVDRDALGLAEISQESDTQYVIIDFEERIAELDRLLDSEKTPRATPFIHLDTSYFLDKVQTSSLNSLGHRSISIELPSGLNYDIRPANGFTIIPYLRLRKNRATHISPSDDPAQFGNYRVDGMAVATTWLQYGYTSSVIPPLYNTKETPITVLLEIAKLVPGLNIEEISFDAIHPLVLLRGAVIMGVVMSTSGTDAERKAAFNEIHAAFIRSNDFQWAEIPVDEALIAPHRVEFEKRVPAELSTDKVHYVYSRLTRESIIDILARNRARRMMLQDLLEQKINGLISEWLKKHPGRELNKADPNKVHHVYLTGPTAAGKSTLQAYLEHLLGTAPVEQSVENNPDPWLIPLLGKECVEATEHSLAFGGFNLSVYWYLLRQPLVDAVKKAYEEGKVPAMIFETLGLSGLNLPKDILKSPGTHTIVVVSADPDDKAIARMTRRGDLSDRYVPPEVLKTSYKNVSLQFLRETDYFSLKRFLRDTLLTSEHQILVCDSGLLYATPERAAMLKKGKEDSLTIPGDIAYRPANKEANPIIMRISLAKKTEIYNYPRVVSFLARSGLPVNAQLMDDFLELIPTDQAQKVLFRKELLKVVNGINRIQEFAAPYLVRDEHRRKVQSDLAAFFISNPAPILKGLSAVADYLMKHFDFEMPGLGAYALARQIKNPDMLGQADKSIKNNEDAVSYLKKKLSWLRACGEEPNVSEKELLQAVLALYTVARQLTHQYNFVALWNAHSAQSGHDPKNSHISRAERHNSPHLLQFQSGIQLKADVATQGAEEHMPSVLKIGPRATHSRAQTYFNSNSWPFVAGPSGHTTYYLFPLICMKQEGLITTELAQSYVLAITSMLIHAGAHSLEEIADKARRFLPELFANHSNLYQAVLGEQINDMRFKDWMKQSRFRMALIQPAVPLRVNQRLGVMDQVQLMRRHPKLIQNLDKEEALSFVDAWRRRFETDFSNLIKKQRQLFLAPVKRMSQAFIILLQKTDVFPQEHELYAKMLKRFVHNPQYADSLPISLDLVNKDTIILMLKKAYLPLGAMTLIHYGLFRYIHELCPQLDSEQTALFDQLKTGILDSVRREMYFSRKSYVPGIVLDELELRDLTPSQIPYTSYAGTASSKQARILEKELAIPFVAGPSGHMAFLSIGYQLLLRLLKEHAPDEVSPLEDESHVMLYFWYCVATYIASGSHSMHECFQVLAAFKKSNGDSYFPYKAGSYGELLEVFAESNWFHEFSQDATQGYSHLLKKRLDVWLQELFAGMLQTPTSITPHHFFAPVVKGGRELMEQTSDLIPATR